MKHGAHQRAGWLSPTEALARANRVLGTSHMLKTLHKWMEDGLPHTRIAGTTVRIHSADLEAWLDAMEYRHVAELVRHPKAGPALRAALARKR